jgi:hypothetical protein
MIVMANDIKTKGVSFFDKLFKEVSEVIINVRGKNKYVVIDIERYKHLRALELDNLYDEVKKDIENNNYTTNIDEHLENLKKIANEL